MQLGHGEEGSASLSWPAAMARLSRVNDFLNSA
jgi:hypothetical protein